MISNTKTLRRLVWSILLVCLLAPFQIISQVVADFSYDQDCETVQFNDLSQAFGLAVITGYLWDFTDGGSSTVQNPEHTYLLEGSYQVELKVYYTDGGGNDSTTLSKWVYFYFPMAIFSSNPVCYGNSTEFLSEAATGDGTTLDPSDMLWDFENNGLYTASGNTVSHIYDTPGIQSVLFEVTNSVGCTHATIQNVEVFQNPVAGFQFNPGCPGDATIFKDASVPYSALIDSWSWDFGDGSPVSNEQNPQHVFSANGAYGVSLFVVNSNGCVHDTVKTIVLEKPTADFEYTKVCAGEPTSFTDLSYGTGLEITSWKWDFGDGIGFASDQNPEYTYLTHGVYDVELVVGNSMGCYDTVVHQVLVDSLPIAGFTVSISCAGLPTCFTDTSIANSPEITSWHWNFGNGSSSTLQNPCHIYSDTGYYNVTLIVVGSNGCQSEPFTHAIYVSYSPLAIFANTEACYGSFTEFANLSDTLGIEVASWLWDFGDPESGDENFSDLYEPVHQFSEPGDYVVTLTVENIHGCASSYQNTVKVNVNPEADFLSPDTIADGVQFNITDLSIGQGSPIITRMWDFGDGNVVFNINPVIYTYSEPGIYEICLTVENFFGCIDQYCQVIVVTALPVADFEYLSDDTFETAFFDDSHPAEDVVNWFWSFGDPTTNNDTISGVPNPVWLYPEEGWYTATLIVTDRFGGVGEISKPVYAGNAVKANFDAISVCFGDTTFFIDYSSSPVSANIETWYWSFGNGQDTVYYEPADTVWSFYTQPGTYEIKFAVSAHVLGILMSDTLVYNLIIYEKPVIRILDENLGVCYGTTIHFKDASVSSSNDPISSWLWDFDDGNFSSLKNPVHSFADTGSFHVVLYVETENGCAGSDSAWAYVNFTPNFGFIVKNNCLNSPAQFIPAYDSTKMKITSWNWNFGDYLNPGNTSTEARPYHTYSRIDIYEVTMEMEAYGCAGKKTQTVLIYPIPFSDFSLENKYEGIQGRTKFNNQSVFSINYFWDFGNGNTSTVESPIEVFEFDSTYTVTLISYNEYACSDTTRHTITVFFRGLYFPTAFSPANPNREVSRFAPKGINLRQFSVQVFDLKGNLVWETDKLDENGSPVESWDGYNLSGILLPQGMYVWKAHGIFLDGTAWRGQTFNGEEPKTSGVVTLIH